jgi:hypothetical protein
VVQPQLKAISQKRSQHQASLVSEDLGGRIALAFGEDIEAVGVDPIRTSRDLNVV